MRHQSTRGGGRRRCIWFSLIITILTFDNIRRKQCCHAFSACSINSNIITSRTRNRREKLIIPPTTSSRFDDTDESIRDGSDTTTPFSAPPIVPVWSRTPNIYLQLHQSVRKRRVIRRLVEIASILSGQIFRPLLCSLTTDGGPFRWRKITTATKRRTYTDNSNSSNNNNNNNTIKNNNNPTTTPTIPQFDTDWWDSFWLRQVRHGSPMSNAQRVAQGLPGLGPAWTKLGQALATRPDILHVPLAEALANLQDNVSPFDNLTAKRIIRRELDGILYRKHDTTTKSYLQHRDERKAFLNSISEQPIASGTIAQVYKADLPRYGPVAIKVQRPGIRKKVEQDATLFHSTATWLEGLEWPRGTPMEGQRVVGSTQVVRLVDEFTSRVFEDMDFTREANNMVLFSNLYDEHRGSSETVRVVVPECISELCSDKIIVMEWIEGTKLTDISCEGCGDDQRQTNVEENLQLVKRGIECTLSQLFEHGLLHADPHTGNLLKVRTTKDDGTAQLGYLDFGLVSSVPQSFRDGVVCATVQLVFARNIHAVADLCVDLGLLPRAKLEDDPVERQQFVSALQNAFDEILVWPKDQKGRSTAVPKLCSFSQGLAAMTKLITSYEFTVPPYFLNNCRALATLEGIALTLDPNFNILRVIYPYAINQLMCNPRVSRKTEETFLDICRSSDTKLVDYPQAMMLLNDWSILTGYPKRKVFWDLATSIGGRRVSRAIVRDFFRKRFRTVRAWWWWFIRRRLVVVVLKKNLYTSRQREFLLL